MTLDGDESGSQVAPAAGDGPDEDEILDAIFAREGWLLQLTKQLGGAVKALAIAGRYAYVCKGYRLLVLDLNDRLRPVIVGRSATLDQVALHVDVWENLAVVATFTSVFLFDVGDPAAPRPRCQIPIIAEHGRVALRFPYLEVDGFTLEDDEATFTFDISDPANPVRIAVAPRDRYFPAPAGLRVGRYRYRPDGDRLHIEDLSDPSRPIHVRALRFAGEVVPGDIIGQCLYVAAEDGLHVLDCADPAHPAECYSFLTGERFNQVLILGQTACVVSDPVGVYTFDVRNPAAPVPLAHFGYPHFIETAEAGDGVLYLATAGPPHGGNTPWTADGERARGLLALDIRNPRRPVVTPVNLGLHTPSLVALAGDRAYVVDGDDVYSGLRCLDLRDEDDTGARSWVRLGQRCDALAAHGSLAVAGVRARLVVFDFADPERPMERGSFRTEVEATRIIVANHIATVLAGAYVYVVSMRDPRRPRPLATLTLARPALDVAVAGRLLVVLQEDGLLVVERKGRAFREVGRWASTTDFNSLALSGSVALLAHREGITVVDLGDPRQPREVGAGHTLWRGDGGEDIVVCGGYALCRDWADIFVLDLADPHSPTLVDRYHTWDYPELTPRRLATDGRRVVAAAQEGGLLLFEFGEGGQAGEAADRARRKDE